MATLQGLLNGDRSKGQDIRTQNMTAILAIANIVKTSLGPVGLDKVGSLLRAALFHIFAALVPPQNTPENN